MVASLRRALPDHHHPARRSWRTAPSSGEGKIVLAVDGSAPSDRAAKEATDLALKLGSEVIVVHVKESEKT
jgi:K+-sensing histidine kinase KdpD